MFPEQKNNEWRPTASLNHLRARAEIVSKIRQFFAARGVLEVETPQLCCFTVTAPFIDSIAVQYYAHPQAAAKTYYLQTSPEYAMKRLLAAGMGPIYQLAKAFRQGEVGAKHNPEFTMLEWYRPQFSYHQLMDEVDDLLQCILNTDKADKASYQDTFLHYLKIDPHYISLAEMHQCLDDKNIQLYEPVMDVDMGLQLLFAHCIEPHLGKEKPFFLYDFPQSQAALARILPTTPPKAARFEVYYQGTELANGFDELQDANEQRMRFEENRQSRQALGLKDIALDEYFLSALEHGLPNCAGVALGLDRLVMLALSCNTISEVLSFSFERI